MRRVLNSWWIVFLLSLSAMLFAPQVCSIDRMQFSKALSDLSALGTALDMFYSRIGRYPSTADNLKALTPEFVNTATGLQLEPPIAAAELADPRRVTTAGVVERADEHEPGRAEHLRQRRHPLIEQVPRARAHCASTVTQPPPRTRSASS